MRHPKLAALRAPRAFARAIAFALVAAGPALGEPEPVTLEPVVVEGSAFVPELELDNEAAREEIERTPGGVALVPDERIGETRGATLEDALDYVAGVLVRSRGTGEEPQLSIRGSGLRNNFHTRGVNVWIDGVPFHNADGFSDVESFELLAAERIEVYKGANSLRYGGSALGGGIQLVTRSGRSAEPLRLRTEGGSFGYLKTFASTGGVRGPWDAYLAASDTRSHGFRDHAEQDRQRLYASLGRRFDGGAALRVFVNGARNRQELPGALTRAEFRDDPSQASRASEVQDEARDYEYGRAALALAVPVGDDRSVELYGQLNHQDLWHPLAFGIIDNETTNANGELRFVASDPLFGRTSRLQLGLQGGWTYQPQEIHENLGGSRGPTFESQRASASAAALYAIEELSLSERLALVGGVRLQYAGRELDDRDLVDDEFDTHPDDSGSADFFAVLPSLGLRYALLEGLELYANAGRSYEPPVLFESTAPGNLNGDLSDLEAQDAWQFELGARAELGDRVRFDVAVYDVEVRDEIRNLNVDPTGQGFFTIPRYENVDRSRHWGIELFADALIARDVASRLGLPGDDALRLALAYTFSRFVYVDDPVFGGNDLPGAPRHFLRGELRWEHASGFWIAPNVEWTPRGWFVDSANTERAPAYVLANVRLGYDHGPSGLSVFGEVRNVFDRDFVSSVVVDTADGRSYEPGDGRGFFAGVEWRWR